MSNHPIRRQNLLKLYAQFVAEAQKNNPEISVYGLDKQFAARLQIANTALSSMKIGSRSIGPKLARQIEAACNRPIGWLDSVHFVDPSAPAEPEPSFEIAPASQKPELVAFLHLAKQAWEKASSSERQALELMLKPWAHRSKID